MYDRFGEKEFVIQFYEKAINGWRNADRDYVPLVDAQIGLAKLKEVQISHCRHRWTNIL